jgi:predicted TPR repeat methyltransferase
MDNAKEYYNKSSRDYADKWGFLEADLNKPANFYRKIGIDLLIESAGVKNGDKVVEIGCGTGLVLRELLKKTSPVFGVDVSIEMLKRAQDSVLKDKRAVILEDFSNLENRSEEVFLALDDFSDLHIVKNYFDKILSLEVFRYICDLDKALYNARNVMKENTIFVFTLTNFWSFSFFPIKYSFRKFIGLVNERKELLQYFVTEKLIRKKLREQGLEIVRFEKLNLLSLNPLVARFVKNRKQAEMITRVDRRLSKTPFINKLFDTFLIAVRKVN